MKINFLTIFLVATALLLPIEATAQSDGGKKKKKARTEQAASIKKRTNKQHQTKQKPTTGTIAGHEWVDLGLPSGLKWATCNVGASSPEEYGDYFAWGEINTKDLYTGATSTTEGKNISELHSKKIIDSDGNLTLSFDAARMNWGESWRMPTKDEIQELIDNCNWEWTNQEGHSGYIVTGANGTGIFLPAAGIRFSASLSNNNEEGSYLSSSICPNDRYVHDLSFERFGYNESGGGSRIGGQTIRPVTE